MRGNVFFDALRHGGTTGCIAAKKNWFYCVSRQQGTQIAYLYTHPDLLKFIDWIMHMSEDYEKLFWQELEKLEEEEKMPYVTSWERLGYKRGYDEASI